MTTTKTTRKTKADTAGAQASARVAVRRGRPSRYNASYAMQAREAIAMSGMTDRQLARLFGVDGSTLTRWRKEHPEFAEACRKGRDAYDSCEVEAALLKRAKGYKVVEVTKEPVLVVVPGEGAPRLVGPELRVTKAVTKHVAPDTGAARYWLANRDPERWRDRQEVRHTGEVDVRHTLPPAVVEAISGYMPSEGVSEGDDAGR